jgi:peptidoglycan/LPS O-acetylase OafA/YrhL
MYHPIAIMITLKALYSINISNIYIQILMSVSLTVFIAGVSYKYFESYFIKKKNIFTKIVSGEEAI